jgi:hypothetical protein
MPMAGHKTKVLHNWRDLLKEWGIIVLGVLTALFAEQAVQSFEWHQKVDAAIADMDNELTRGNGPQAYARLAMHDCVASQLGDLRGAIERGDRAQSQRLIEAFWLPKRTWDSLARESATASDIASHMPHDRMLQYRIAYEVVPDLQRLADKELGDLGNLRALPETGGAIQTSEKIAALQAIESLKLDNDATARESTFLLSHMQLMHLALDRDFVGRNMQEPRQQLGNCLKLPDVKSATPN